MGFITILEDTTKTPLSLIGKMAGQCWGSDTTDDKKNIKRALECIDNQHGRTLEFPDVYMVLEGFSARVMREFYTHIGGAPTRLQASTRYINYDKFNYIIPPKILKDPKARAIYEDCMSHISKTVQDLVKEGVPKEDAAMALPLGMTTTVVCKMNLRTMIEMMHQRLCTRAYWEFKLLCEELCRQLSAYSDQWWNIVVQYFEPKCEFLGYCPEKYSCGRSPKK